MLILQTERLTLRRFGADDADFILELVNDPSWIRHIGDRGLRTPDDARQWIESSLVDHYNRQGFGLWAVQRRGDGELLGMCGLLRRSTLPAVDVGYAFVPRHRGQGYAREAALACLRYGRDELGLSRILAITSPDNAPSQRVLERIGMRLEERRVLPGEARETLIYAWVDEPSARISDER